VSVVERVASSGRRPHFFTICARNYLAHAAALAESLRTHHPDCALTVFLLDGERVPECASRLNIRPIQDAVSADEHERRLLYYDLLELSTCVKAECFTLLFAEGSTLVIYLDPDVYVFSPLDAAIDAAVNGAVAVVTPHVLSPIPDDAAKPDDLLILQSGIYNLGFLALRHTEDTERFLAWWASKLRWQCFIDHARGSFTDQKWMDFAPVFLRELHILRDTTYNVAYWNLSQRLLERGEDDAWRVDGAPLTFFHFSGYDATKPRVLSKHENRIVRAVGPLKALLKFYADRLHALGFAEVSRLPFSAPAFRNGASWDAVCREVYRSYVAAGDTRLHPLRDDHFISYMSSPAPGQRLPRYAQALLSMRPHLVTAYANRRDWDGLVAWMSTRGAREMGIDKRLLQTLGFIRSEQRRPLCVSYVGYLRAHLGIAQAARGYVDALSSADVRLKLVDVSGVTSSGVGDYPTIERLGTGDWDDDCDFHIIHVNADQLELVLSTFGPRRLRQPRIGVWAWETLEFPEEWLGTVTCLDELWVSSRFIANAIAPHCPFPVLTIPYAVSPPQPSYDRAALGLPEDEFIVLVQLDVFSTIERKNPEGAIAAFKKAFDPREPVRLVVKTMNGAHDSSRVEKLASMVGDARVSFWDEALDGVRMASLLASADCHMSLHRAEGFGLSLAESMACAKPVIATGWSGNTDFMNDRNSILIPYELRPISRDHGPYRAGTIWADPDVDAAAEALRKVWKDREWSDAIGKQAAIDIARDLSPIAIGNRVRARLMRLRELHERNGTLGLSTAIRPAWSILTHAGRNPRQYVRHVPVAWAYYRQHGLRALTSKVHEKLASRWPRLP